MNSFVDWSALRSQWQQSPLLRWGALGIASILAVYLLLVLGDAGKALKREVGALQERNERLQSLLQQDQWVQRAKASRTLRVQLEGRLWPAATRGLAQANVQGWLDREVAKAKFTSARVKVEAAQQVPHMDGLWQIPARVEGQFAREPLLQLLLAIESHSQQTVVDRLEVENNRFTLMLKAYAQPAGGQNE